MRVLVAFDKFKGTLSAQSACRVAVDAIREVYPRAIVDACPIADGGDGFAKTLAIATPGIGKKVLVRGPLGDSLFAELFVLEVPSQVRQVGGRVAVMDMAQASGLALVPEGQREVWCASSLGTGDLISVAAREPVGAIILGLGGSATHDLGLGALSALGLQAIDANGKDLIPPSPGKWRQLSGFRGEVQAHLPPIFLATDVTNPLVGEWGAARVYGPQKGLSAARVAEMEELTAQTATKLCTHFGASEKLMYVAGTGAAGGLGFGLNCAVEASILSGFGLFSEWFDLTRRIAEADVVITGEGCFDDTSFSGKGPGEIIERASSAGKRIGVVAGRVCCSKSTLITKALFQGTVPAEEILERTPARMRECVIEVIRELGV